MKKPKITDFFYDTNTYNKETAHTTTLRQFDEIKYIAAQKEYIEHLEKKIKELKNPKKSYFTEQGDFLHIDDPKYGSMLIKRIGLGFETLY